MTGETQNPGEKKRKEKNFTEGSLGDRILFFTLPMILSNILQQLFNTADIAVVGRLVGNDALAAVGCTGPIVTLSINIFTGLAVGANALIARMIGEGDKESIRKSVHAAVAIALVSGLVVMLVGEMITVPLLALVKTPEHVMADAVSYLRIYFAGSIFVMLYNFEAAILRAGGDTKRPLYLLMISGFANIVLNLLFVLVCGLDVKGVALATLIANAISAGLLFRVLVKDRGEFQVHVSQIRFQSGLAKTILMIGIPSAAQGVLFNIANIVLQSGINSLGATAVAGSTVGMNVEVFAHYIALGFGQASITFNGQNLGAKKLERCVASTRWCLGIGFVFTAVSSAVTVLLRETLAGFFTSDAEVIRIAALRISLIAGFQLLSLITEVMSGALRGWGHSFIPAFLSLFFVCGTRILWLFFAFPLNRTFEWLFAIYPISLGLAALVITIAYFVTKRGLMKACFSGRSA